MLGCDTKYENRETEWWILKRSGCESTGWKKKSSFSINPLFIQKVGTKYKLNSQVVFSVNYQPSASLKYETHDYFQCDLMSNWYLWVNDLWEFECLRGTSQQQNSLFSSVSWWNRSEESIGVNYLAVPEDLFHFSFNISISEYPSILVQHMQGLGGQSYNPSSKIKQSKPTVNLHLLIGSVFCSLCVGQIFTENKSEKCWKWPRFIQNLYFEYKMIILKILTRYHILKPLINTPYILILN